MEEEIDIIIQTDEGKKYILSIPKQIKYSDLKQKVRKLIAKNNRFDIRIKDKRYGSVDGDKLLTFKPNDKIFFLNNIIEECAPINANFHINVNLDEADMRTVDLTGLLQLFLLKYIAINLDNVNRIKSIEIRNIISDLKKNVELTNDPKKDIKANLSQKSGSNIITYVNYIKEIITTKDIDNLINLFDKNGKIEIKKRWSVLSKYEDFNKLFEKDFLEALKNTYFEYSLIGISLYQHDKRKKYIEKLKKCIGCEVKYVFHGTQIDPIKEIITDGFLYTRKPFYGMGIYFSDMLDYVSFYCGGETYEDRRKNFGKILPVGKTFSCIGTEIYYDRNLKEDVYDFRYSIKELDHFPTLSEIKEKYSKQMVEENGLHFAKVEPQKGHVVESLEENAFNKRKGKFIGTEYVITDMDQILPLYGLTLKRIEYLVIWRDPGFKKYNNYLEEAKMSLNKNVNINIYIETCTEKALELIKRKKFNKIILISSIDNDLSGKKFVEIARKILGFDVVVLFFSENDINPPNWLKNFPNALYANVQYILEEYVKNYSKDGLLLLKQEIELNYNIEFNFTKNYFDFPKFINNKKFEDITFEEVCDNFRKVVIKNKKNKKALCMDKNRNVTTEDYEGKDIELLIWYVTIINGEITLFSNEFYLGLDNSKKPKGRKSMKIWKYIFENSKFYIYYGNTKNTLTIDAKEVVIKEFNKNNENQLFELFDYNDNY